MRAAPQEEFRRRVKIWLAHNNVTVTELARRIGRRRDSVSQAIHHGCFPRVHAKIAQAIASNES